MVCNTHLPPYAGQFDVGTIDIEVPLDAPHIISDTRIAQTSELAFQVDTVLFSLFYPSTKGAKSKKEKHFWVSRPITLHGEGYARMAGGDNCITKSVLSFAVSFLVGESTIHAEVDVPLHSETTPPGSDSLEGVHTEDQAACRFPIVVFSHGTASTRTSYSHFCGELASRGCIVVAIEHRDGSGPGSLISSNNSTRYMPYINEDTLTPSLETASLRRIQLSLRQFEIETVIGVLRGLNEGQGSAFYRTNPRKEGRHLFQWKDRLDLSNVTIAGHSFGATLALQCLKGAPSEALPFAKGIMFDPGKSSGPLNDDINVPVLIIHSQAWSQKHTIFHGRPHFDVVKQIAQKLVDRGIPAWFITSRGTSHPSITDAPLLKPKLLTLMTGASVDPRDSIKRHVDVSYDFTRLLGNSTKTGILVEPAKYPIYRGMTKGLDCSYQSESWRVHISPN